MSDKKDYNVVTEEQETKADKFKRIAQRRLETCVTSIRSLAKTASSDYEYTEEQVGVIKQVLHKEISNLENAFEGKKPQSTIPQL